MSERVSEDFSFYLFYKPQFHPEIYLWEEEYIKKFKQYWRVKNNIIKWTELWMFNLLEI